MWKNLDNDIKNFTVSQLNHTGCTFRPLFRADLDCPIYDEAILLPLGFWLEGVVQCTIALLGLIGNLISAIILSR